MDLLKDLPNHVGNSGGLAASEFDRGTDRRRRKKNYRQEALKKKSHIMLPRLTWGRIWIRPDASTATVELFLFIPQTQTVFNFGFARRARTLKTARASVWLRPRYYRTILSWA